MISAGKDDFVFSLRSWRPESIVSLHHVLPPCAACLPDQSLAGDMAVLRTLRSAFCRAGATQWGFAVFRAGEPHRSRATTTGPLPIARHFGQERHTMPDDQQHRDVVTLADQDAGRSERGQPAAGTGRKKPGFIRASAFWASVLERLGRWRREMPAATLCPPICLPGRAGSFWLLDREAPLRIRK